MQGTIAIREYYETGAVREYYQASATRRVGGYDKIIVMQGW